jgi:transcriptional regulator with XRE-family HTH domain
MDLATLRKQRNLSQEELGVVVGIRSRGRNSEIESGTRPASLRVALLIEAWSGGLIRAETLSPKAGALRSQLADVTPKKAARRR